MFFRAKNGITQLVFCIFLCLCSSLCFTWSATMFSNVAVGAITSIILCFPMIALHRLNKKNEVKLNKASVVICFLLAFLWLMAESFKPGNAALFSYISGKTVLFSVVYTIGAFHLLTEFAKIFHSMLHASFSSTSKLSEIISGLSAKKIFILLCIFYIPHILMSFPGMLCVDSDHQLAQFFGRMPFTAHHPPAHTLLLGTLIQIGTFISGGHQIFGYFLFILVQSFILLFILTYMFVTMKKLRTPGVLMLISFLLVTVSPYFTAYAGAILKDCLYSYMFLLFMIEFLWLLVLKQDYWKSALHHVLYFVSVCGVYLFRNNGKHVLVIAILSYLIFLLKTKAIQKTKKNIVFLILPIVISFVFSAAIMHIFSIEKGSIKETLSLPFQQTARYVLQHHDEVTPKEKEAIDRILAYDQLAEIYDPNISDPVKETYKNPSMQEFLSYVGVWATQGWKHPYTYIEATVEQNQSLYYPFMVNGTICDINVLDSHPIFAKISDIRTKLYHILFH